MKRRKTSALTQNAKLIIIVSAIAILALFGAYQLFMLGYAQGKATGDIPKDNAFQMLCFHNWSPTGECSVCHLNCPHESFNDSQQCSLCGYRCSHSWVKGKCSMCGLKCEHPSWENGICQKCSGQCPHPGWENSTCTFCGFECNHEWVDCICSKCGYVCTHKDHDAETRICELCGDVTTHKFTNGVCSCGAAPDFHDTALGKDFFAESDKGGTVETVMYQTPLYDEAYDGLLIDKEMSVYLPYRYSPDSRYNVMLLVPGGEDPHSAWLTDVHSSGGISMTGKNLLDNMISSGIIEPMIVVSIDTAASIPGHSDKKDTGIDQISKELRDIILPYIVENFSTYAEDSAPESIEAVRDHFGLGGMSNGALYTYNSGMQENFDLIGNYLCISGCNEPKAVAERINSEEWSSLPICAYYAGAGTTDKQKDNSQKGFNLLLESTERLNEDANAFYSEVEGGHEWKVWYTITYNALQVMFQRTD